MSFRIFLGLALGALSIGGAYALTAAHDIDEVHSDIALSEIEPSLPETQIDSAKILSYQRKFPLRQQEPNITPLPVATLHDQTAQLTTQPETNGVTAIETSPRPLARPVKSTLPPQQKTISPRTAPRSTQSNQPLVQSNQRKARTGSFWAIGVFR